MAAVETLTVALGERSYSIYFGHGLAPSLAQAVAESRKAGRRLAVVTDENVRQAIAPFFNGALNDLPVVTVPAGETSKSVATFGHVCEFLAMEKIDRGGVVVAVRQQVGLPVKFIGVGEKADDLAPFSPDRFVEALFDEIDSRAP